jgi:glycosyltransferase involved in cell wall biosynthesis
LKTFSINNTSPTSGPGIFGYRLFSALIDLGFEPSLPLSADNNISIIEGTYIRHSNNILRLDGLYLDSEDPDINTKNAGIYGCYTTFDHIVFQSEFSKQCYEATTGVSRKNSSVIYNGVGRNFNQDSLKMPFVGGKKVVIASSSWRRHKRLEEIVDAFSDDRLKNVFLIVLNGKNYSRNIKDSSPNVRFLPNIYIADLPDYYRNADAMIHLAWLDWCPNVVIEALCSGLPVLCSSNGGTKELIRPGIDGIVIELEEQYIPGTKIPLYNPPRVNRETIIEGILNILDFNTPIPVREDLYIDNVAKKYIEIMQ